MKHILSVTLFFLCQAAYACLSSPEFDAGQNKILSKTSVKVSSLFYAPGELWADEDGFIFIPSEKCYSFELFNKLITCHNELIEKKEFKYSEIQKIVRRNPLLIFPNRFVIIMNDGSRYRFYSFKRKKVIEALKAHRDD